MNAPTTELRKTARLNGGRLWWRSPGFVGTVGGDGLPGGEAASVTYRPPAGDVVSALTPAWTTMTVTGSASRGTLTATATVDVLSATLPFGDAWLYTARGGVVPVRVGTVTLSAGVYTITLVDRLKYDMAAGAESRLQAQLWYVDETAAGVVGSVTRSTAGDFPIPYTIGWPVLQPASPAGGGGVTPSTQRVEGTLSVVRQPFTTGLSSDDVRALYPELGRLSQSGSAGIEAAIYAEHRAMALRVSAAVREAGASPYTWADDVEGAAFQLAHAAMVAARLVESTNPERAERYAAQSGLYFRQALALAWTDLNRDGVVDEGESPGLVGITTAAKALPSVVPTRTAWWGIGERR
jgi:hypothetical protein